MILFEKPEVEMRYLGVIILMALALTAGSAEAFEYKIRRCDTIGSLAQEWGLTADQLLQANRGMTKDTMLMDQG